MTSIFFSYRSLDNAVASRILERLNANYGHEHVHTTIPRGVLGDQDQHIGIENYMANIDVFVLLIGQYWAQTRNRLPRIGDPQDTVRLVVAAALAKGVPLIPVLAGRVAMPAPDELPDELKTLAQQTPLSFTSDDTFRGDMMRLHNRIAAKRIRRNEPAVSPERDDSPPSGFRKQELQARAQSHQHNGQPPFDGLRINSLGEVLWILGAQSGELATMYGERQFPPDLSGADLSGLNLSDADMYQAKLTKAVLTDANLTGTNLTGAQLGGANLAGANLSHARLGQADLRGAIVTTAQLAGAILRGANLNHLDLSKALLGNNVFDDADLSGANLRWLDLSGGSFRRATLSGAKLTDVGLHGVHLEGAQFGEADLSRSDMSKVILKDASDPDQPFVADLTDATLVETDLSGVDLSGVTISSVTALRHAILDSSTNLSDVKWGGKSIDKPQKLLDRDKRAAAYRKAAQTNHEIAEMYRNMGLSSQASTYRLKELQMRRGLLRNSGAYGSWLTSTLLNVFSGYGERLSRILITYLVLVFGFAAIYFVSSNFLGLGVGHLSIHDAIIESFVSFHGRGFVITTLRSGDPMAGVTVVEAVFGLFVEAILIATFSRRFFNL